MTGVAVVNDEMKRRMTTDESVFAVSRRRPLRTDLSGGRRSREVTVLRTEYGAAKMDYSSDKPENKHCHRKILHG